MSPIQRCIIPFIFLAAIKLASSSPGDLAARLASPPSLLQALRDAATAQSAGLGNALHKAHRTALRGASSGPVRNTTSGLVAGLSVGSTASFLGIPFASPPVGSARWKPPRPVQPWEGVRPANAFGPACAQHANAFTIASNVSEDCLYLNVYTPLNASHAALPVLVFWYGGSWESGNAGFPLYWGSQDVELLPEVVIVTTNYRLGPFGFLASPSLAAQDPDGSTGNYGIQDQRAALQWVRANIASFGGDPRRVTIAGQGAGAGSVSNHLVMPRSAGLFAGAITESGPFAPWSAQTLSQSSVKFLDMAGALGCAAATNASALTDPAVLRCLRSATTQELLHATGAVPGSGLLTWSPVVDGVELAATPADLAAAGRIVNAVPVLQGSNLNEGSMFTDAWAAHDITPAQFETALSKWLLGNATAAAQVARLYPPSAYNDTWWAFSAALGQGAVNCPTRTSARDLAAVGVPVYQYYYTHELALVRELLASQRLGVCHGSELVMVFQLRELLWSAAERELADAFLRYWFNFVATGNPNDARLPHWPVWDASEPVQVLDTPGAGGEPGIRTEHRLLSAQCDYWQANPLQAGVMFGTPTKPPIG